MFPSQMVCLKIVEPSSEPLISCFPRKWYALKLLNPQVANFFNVSLANFKIVRTLKWPTLSMFPSQILRLKIVEPSSGPLKIVEPSSGPLCPCFPRKWYALKLLNLQVNHLFHVYLANGTP